MKKILVPTDFSETATNAVHYAAALCKQVDCSLKLLNVMHLPMVDVNSAVVAVNSLMESAKEEVEEKLFNLMLELKTKYDISVDYESEFGLASDVIAEQAKTDTLLVVMGTNGASGMIERMLGSVSSSVAKNLEIPLLVLPDNAIYKKVERVVFAYDNKAEIEDNEKFIRSLSDRPILIDVVSVEELGNAGHYEKEIVLETKDKNEVCIWADTVEIGINKYVKETNPDAIILRRHKRNFFEELFHRSTTKQFLIDGKLPMFVFNN